MEQHGRKLDSWDKLVETEIDNEAKENIQTLLLTRVVDHHCLRGNRPAHTTVA